MEQQNNFGRPADPPVAKPFECVFGAFRPRLQFLGPNQLEITIGSPGGAAVQVVEVEAMDAGPGMLMLSWT